MGRSLACRLHGAIYQKFRFCLIRHALKTARFARIREQCIQRAKQMLSGGTNMLHIGGYLPDLTQQNLAMLRRAAQVSLIRLTPQHIQYTTGMTATTARQPPQQGVQARGGDLHRKMTCGRIFQVVRFIKDDLRCRRQRHARRGHLSKHQRVVRDHHMRPQGAVASFLQKTTPIETTAAPRAFLPQRSQLQQKLLVHAATAAQFIHVASAGQDRPGHGACQGAHLRAIHLVLAMIQQATHPAQAEIIGTPLDQCHPQRRSRCPKRHPLRHLLHQGEILVEQLRLQVARVSADHNRHIVQLCPEHSGQQIGHALSHAGASLDHQMTPIVKSLHHTAQHLDLPGPRLIPGHQPRHGSAGLQQRGHRIHIQR